MTDRREAVRAALMAHMNSHGPICSDALAQAAIEANDAWLKVKKTCPNCECKHNQDATYCWVCCTPLGGTNS